MNDIAGDFTGEVRRIHRVSDMLCSAHASMRDRYSRKALLLDTAILALSTWVVALVFIEPHIGSALTPLHINPVLWIGFVSIASFFLSIVQVKVDWKGCSDKHAQALNMYAQVKRECSYMLASEHGLAKSDCHNILVRYEMAGSLGVEIAENEFLRQKARHLQKLEISRYLDTHPSASVILIRIKARLRDNRAPKKEHGNE
jgi:hypothetical protein